MTADVRPVGENGFLARGWRRFVPAKLRSGFTGNALKLGGGTAIGQILVAAATPLITRLYSPSDVALMGLVVSFVTFASVGVALRYDLAIVTAVDDDEANILLLACFVFSGICSLLGSSIFGVCVASNILSYGALPLWGGVPVFFMLLLMGLSSSLRYWYVRRAGFGTISRALVAQGGGRATGSVGIGLLHPGWLGLAIGEMTGRSFAVLRLLKGIRPGLASLSKVRLHNIRRALYRNRKYPLVLLPSSLLNSASAIIVVPIIISLFGQKNGGQFFLVQNLLTLPGVLIANSVADVLHARFADAFRTQPGSLRGILGRTYMRLTGIALLIYVPIAILAPFVIPPILGTQWEKAGIIASILTPVMIAGLVVNPASRILIVVDRPEWKLLADVLRLSLPPVSVYVTYTAGWSFLPSLVAYACAASVATGIYILIVWYVGTSKTAVAM